jgi:hypothetical protein
MDGAKISPKTLDSENDIDTLCLRAVHALMKDGASRKKLSPRDIRAQKRTKLKLSLMRRSYLILRMVALKTPVTFALTLSKTESCL